MIEMIGHCLTGSSQKEQTGCPHTASPLIYILPALPSPTATRHPKVAWLPIFVNNRKIFMRLQMQMRMLHACVALLSAFPAPYVIEEFCEDFWGIGSSC